MRPDWERFWSKVDASGDCWLWMGCLNRQGYGNFRSTDSGRAKTMLSHRWAWEALVGPIPAGHDLDHLCEIRACVYVGAHVMPATPARNRTRSGSGIARLNAMKTHCSQGHPLFGDNLQLRMSGGRLIRRCALCHREQERARNRRLRGETA